MSFAALAEPVRAAELAGTRLPDVVQADGATLQLNGIGLRTYSFLRIRIYVAGLYLQHPSSDAQAILRSPEIKLLTMVFKRGIGAGDVRDAWRTGLQDNCRLPCRLDPTTLSRFLKAMPAVREGEVVSLLFTPGGAAVSANGQPIETIRQPRFAEAVLAVFLGPKPPTQHLKQALLGNHPPRTGIAAPPRR